MLSRIAKGLYDVGRGVERAQHVMRILEVNHKMSLERSGNDDVNVWTAISESFECGLDTPNEAELYQALVLSRSHPYSVRKCIVDARDLGRAMRDHISEEMWLHLNRTHLEFATLSFDDILSTGRSEFNRRVEVFGDAFHGLADGTMIRGDSWAFIRIGKLVECASMICRILEIKRKSLELAPALEGEVVDVHQWQALLRSFSGYEPYRRAYDARIMPHRVLEFVLQRHEFPRSLRCCLSELHEAIAKLSGGNPVRDEVARSILGLLDEVQQLDPQQIVQNGSIEAELHNLEARREVLVDLFEVGYFTSARPASAPITAIPGAVLVPQ